DTPRQLPTILLTSGAVILALSVLLLGVSVVPASWLSLLIASAIAAWAAWQKRQFSNI
ncbi:MAG: hypothetical protein ACI9CB_001268, partial [Rhodothermales bacterium]